MSRKITALKPTTSITAWTRDRSEKLFNQFVTNVEANSDPEDIKAAMWSHFMLNGVSEKTQCNEIDLTVGGETINLDLLGKLVGSDLRKFLRAWQRDAYDALKHEGSLELRVQLFNKYKFIRTPDNAAAVVDWFDHDIMNPTEDLLAAQFKNARIANANSRREQRSPETRHVDVNSVVDASSTPTRSNSRAY